MKYAVGAFLLAVVALVTWGIYTEITEPDSGTVTAKRYHPMYVTTQCTTSGKVTTCIPTTHPECYEIEYRNGNDTGDACVAPAEYPSYAIGDQYPRGSR